MRHNASLNLTFSVAHGEEFALPFTEFYLPTFITNDLAISFLYNIASGTPYTPANEDGKALDTNSAHQPYTANANLSFNKRIRLGEKKSLKMYLDINNLFDRKNVYQVYARTGKPDDDGVDISDEYTGYVDPREAYLHQLSIENPGMVSNGRTITLGMSYNF